MSTSNSLTSSGSLPAVCTASVWKSTPASRVILPISAMGSMVPTSLLRVHDGDQDGVGPDGLAHVLGIDQTAAVHRHPGDLVAALLQILHGLEHRVVLDGGGDEVLALLLLGVGRAQDGPVVGLGAAAGEVDLVGLGADGAGDGLPGLLHGAGRAESQAVDGGGVAVLLGEPGEHGLPPLPGRSGVVDAWSR